MNRAFKYYGKDPDPNRKWIFSGQPINMAEYRMSELINFRTVFRNEVSSTVRKSVSLFRPSIYENFPPQQSAFDRLEELFKNAKFEILNITRTSFEKNEAVYRVQARIPVMRCYYDRVFANKEMPEGTKGYMLVSFYIGVSREFLMLQKPNELIDQLHKATRKAKDLPEPDEAFDPEKALGGFIAAGRMEPRYNYLASTETFGRKRYYQTPEGFLYLIEIDGYAALTPSDDTVKDGD